MRVSLGAIVLLVTLAAAVPAVGQPLERRLVVVAPEADDPRIAHTRAAIAFWNRTLADLGLDVRLREAALVVGPPGMRAIETFARFVSQRGGRIPKGPDGPQPPPELAALGGDVVVLLSRQPLLPFAWPLMGSPDHLVAIRTARPGRPREDTVLRNVIAHELGHTLGLRHNRGGASLMCGPCSSLAARESPGGWLPLTARDRALLLALHGGGDTAGEPGARGAVDAAPERFRAAAVSATARRARAKMDRPRLPASPWDRLRNATSALHRVPRSPPVGLGGRHRSSRDPFGPS